MASLDSAAPSTPPKPELPYPLELRPRPPSLGVPVGCLVVPGAHMKAVSTALTAEGKSGTPWRRRDGVRPSQAIPGAFEVHLSIEGATRIEAGCNVPQCVRDLLSSGTIWWHPGVRLRHRAPVPPPFTPAVAAAAASSSAAPGTFRFAELFAGIGGFRLGLEALGGRCVFASEICPWAAATYESNFGVPPAFAADITEATESDLPAHDLLVGGFPCQSFSRAGEQKGLADEGRGQLYLEVCRVLWATRPAAFLLENVAALYTMEGGTFDKDYEKRTPGRVHAHIVAALEACGYIVSSRILGAHAFGVP